MNPSESTDDLDQKKLVIPSTLWERVVQQTAHALACGALQSLPTDHAFVSEAEINFLVRILTNLDRKEQATQHQKQAEKQGKPFNPFLPYEHDLFVTDLSPSHVCLLNKFNVVDHHLLIITRAFEEQESWITLADFEALWTCLAQVDGLGFYNGGRLAGASQPHKHLQLVPFPLSPDGSTVPIEAAIATALWENDIGTIPSLPFVHSLMRLDLKEQSDPDSQAAILLTSYQRLLQVVGVSQQTNPYNLLLTRRWMMVIPRSQDQFESIAVNALGFAGALLVRNSEQLEVVKAHGPLKILQEVGLSWL